MTSHVIRMTILNRNERPKLKLCGLALTRIPV